MCILVYFSYLHSQLAWCGGVTIEVGAKKWGGGATIRDQFVNTVTRYLSTAYGNFTKFTSSMQLGTKMNRLEQKSRP